MKLSEVEIVLSSTWIKESEIKDTREEWISCSNCNFNSTVYYKYCPNCGRKMTNGKGEYTSVR